MAERQTTNMTGVDYRVLPGGRRQLTNRRRKKRLAECVPGWQRDNYQQETTQSVYLGGRETTTNRTGVDYAECVPGGRETTTNRTGVDYAECVPGWQRDNYQQDGSRLCRVCTWVAERQLPTGRE